MTGREDAAHSAAVRAARPGEPGFDYEAAFYTEREHRHSMLAKQRALTEENNALWETVVEFTDEPVRDLIRSLQGTVTSLKQDNGKLRSQNNVLRARLDDEGITLTANSEQSIRHNIVEARKEANRLRHERKHSRRRIRSAMERLDGFTGDWLAAQMKVGKPPAHIFEEVFSGIRRARTDLDRALALVEEEDDD